MKLVSQNVFQGLSLLFILSSNIVYSKQHLSENTKILTPHMIKIPAGEFQMGSEIGDEDETPIRTVNIKAFLMSQTEVTFEQWDACVSDGGCSYIPNDEGWGRGQRPVINISYDYVTQQYIPWLNKVTGANFRLPSEAEWEYAARAGSTSQYAWGDEASREYANYGKEQNYGVGFAAGRDKWINTSPVKSFPANQFGLFDMQGNVWEWVEDCWNDSYQGAPNDGTAKLDGDCNSRVLRGGSFNYLSYFMRSANRSWFASSHKGTGSGFRLAMDLEE